MDIYPRIVTDPSGAAWNRKVEEIQKRHTQQIEKMMQSYEGRISALQSQVSRLQRP